jgi:uncharacterized protein
MRLVRLAALALLPLAAAAAADGARPELAPGEVLLETTSRGSASTPATKVTVEVPIHGRGNTPAEARQARDALWAKLAAAARTAGIDAADIRTGRGPMGGFIGNESTPGVGWTVSGPLAQGPSEQLEGTVMEIQLRDPARFERLRAALEAAGAEDVPSPEYRLADERAAKRSAKADALLKAKGEAEAYAATLGLRVSRLLRVSEREGAELGDPDTLQDYMKTMRGEPAENGMVETTVRLSVDFALAPR